MYCCVSKSKLRTDAGEITAEIGRTSASDRQPKKKEQRAWSVATLLLLMMMMMLLMLRSYWIVLAVVTVPVTHFSSSPRTILTFNAPTADAPAHVRQDMNQSLRRTRGRGGGGGQTMSTDKRVVSKV